MAFLFGKIRVDSSQRLKIAEEALEYGIGKRNEPPDSARAAIKKAGGRDKAFDYSIKEVLNIISKDRDNVNAYLFLVKAFGIKGPEYIDAQVTNLKRACELAANTAKGKTALLDSIKGVDSLIGPGLKTFDEELSNWYVQLGDLYIQMGEVEEAIVQYDKAIAQEPANPVPYKRMTNLLIKKGQTSKALDILKEAKETIYYQNPKFKAAIDESLAKIPQ